LRAVYAPTLAAEPAAGLRTSMSMTLRAVAAVNAPATLRELRVGAHECGDAGTRNCQCVCMLTLHPVAIALAELLTDSACTLERVEFDENRLSIDGLQALASAFESNTSVSVMLCDV
jgi:hypothetical protein